ncbi:MAG: UDP-N-acetylglucosamine 1-carboxyvinyltransferase, partial [Planctomycetes bacterium]|nr:UDP-N-acetylglucosamine 1-carboxyvinyltransferase [Planctomycetota bacterium]
QGISVITDKVFPDRFMHLPELMRMGANVRREGACSIISGLPRLSGACVMASDLRASAALLLAALAAEGESVIRRIYHLDRGYDHLELKLNSVGANIERLLDSEQNMPRSLNLTTSDRAESTLDSVEIPAPKFLNRSSQSQPAIRNN